jgi:hypothetical protein
MSGGYESDEYKSDDEVGGPYVVGITQRHITIIKNDIAKLLQISNSSQSDIDAGIAEKMTENEIDFNPNELSLQNQYDKLTELKKKLEQKALQKKGGKRQKSKRYRKSKKQRKTKTKRRLRRSYKYKYK